MRPRLILADEPTGNLDSVAGDEILALLRQAIASFGVAIVMVTHSYLAAGAMDALASMKDGRLVDVEPGAASCIRGPDTLRLVPPRRS